MPRNFFKSIQANRLGLDLKNLPDNINDDPYGPKRSCKKCGRRLNYQNMGDNCGPCRLNLTRPSSLSKAEINKEDKERKVHGEDKQTATARVEICQRYNVSSGEVLDFAKRPRDNGLIFARCLLIYFLVEYLKKPAAEVARVMGMGSRSSVESGYRRGKAIIEVDSRARQIIAEVKEIVLQDGLSPGF